VFTPSVASMSASLVIKSCAINIYGRGLPENLILLDMSGFDVILGMNWLAVYHANVDCLNKEVVFKPSGEPEFKFLGSQICSFIEIISILKANCLQRKGHLIGWLQLS
jgi:hypothetical protein